MSVEKNNRTHKLESHRRSRRFESELFFANYRKPNQITIHDCFGDFMESRKILIETPRKNCIFSCGKAYLFDDNGTVGDVNIFLIFLYIVYLQNKKNYTNPFKPVGIIRFGDIKKGNFTRLAAQNDLRNANYRGKARLLFGKTSAGSRRCSVYKLLPVKNNHFQIVKKALIG